MKASRQQGTASCALPTDGSHYEASHLFFRLISFQGPLPSRAFRVSLTPCVDAQSKGSHVGGVGRVPRDLRTSGSQSKHPWQG